jgi:hypothetical protein
MSLESVFPALANDGYTITSPQAQEYNCVAWAAGASDVWWDPAIGYFWPDDAPREHGIDALKAAFASLGYVECDNEQPETGFEKIALYAQQDEWTHAARLLPNGNWTSKLGPQEDIEHGSPVGLAGTAYGKVACIMKRPIQ